MKIALAGVLVAALGGVSQAGMISHTDLPLGASMAQFTIDNVDVTVEAVGGPFSLQSFQGVEGVGVGGGTFPEVDGAEELVITFSEPVIITGLSFAHLYHRGAFGENNDESVVVTTDGGVFELMATDQTVASWTGAGDVVNESLSRSNAGAQWAVSGDDLLGVAVTSLRLTPGAPGPNSRDDDFSFVHVSWVPSPGAMAIAGLAGVAGLRRRR